MKDSVKLDGVKLGEKKAWWKYVVGIYCILDLCLMSYSQLMNVALPGLLVVLIIVFLVGFLVINETPAGSVRL